MLKDIWALILYVVKVVGLIGSILLSLAGLAYEIGKGEPGGILLFLLLLIMAILLTRWLL